MRVQYMNGCKRLKNRVWRTVLKKSNRWEAAQQGHHEKCERKEDETDNEKDKLSIFLRNIEDNFSESVVKASNSYYGTIVFNLNSPSGIEKDRTEDVTAAAARNTMYMRWRMAT